MLVSGPIRSTSVVVPINVIKAVELIVKKTIHVRTTIGELQSEELQKRLAALPFKITYHEEQHGPVLVALIDCTPAQEKMIREVLREVGAAVTEPVSGEDLG